MDIKNRKAVKCTGTRNFPDDEVYTSPNANSVEGEIFVDLPVLYGGKVIQGIYLKFESGIITDYKAERGNEMLAKIIETDEGSHRLGEIALGMNNGMEKILMHPLFVEKPRISPLGLVTRALMQIILKMMRGKICWIVSTNWGYLINQGSMST